MPGEVSTLNLAAHTPEQALAARTNDVLPPQVRGEWWPSVN
jgi:hypothetical protein